MSSFDQSDPELVELLLRFEDGGLSDSEMDELIDELRSDPAKRNALIETLRMNQELRAAGQKQAAERSLEKRLRMPAKARPVEPSMWKLAAVFVASVVGLWAFVHFGLGGKKGDVAPPVVTTEPQETGMPVASVEESKADTSREIPAPVVPDRIEKVVTAEKPEFAQKDKVHDVKEQIKPEVADVVKPMEIEAQPVLLGRRWALDNKSGAKKFGEPVMSGEHFVESGTYKYRLSNGTRVDVVGPSRLNLLNADKIELISGRLAAEVNVGAKGFIVETGGMSVVDIGTRFAVTANEKGDSAVHVYEGLVEATPKKGAGKTIRLKTGDTRRLNLRTNRLEALLYQTAHFVPSPAWSGSIEGIEGNIVALNSPPESSDQESFQTGGFTVFPERRELVLRRSFTPDMTGPETVIAGNIDSLEPQKIPARTKAATYLVRFSGNGSPAAQGEAVIHFDSPVLGIIFRREQLFATDESMGAKQTQYPAQEVFRAPEKLDELEIAEDRRSVRLKFYTNGAFVDHARIIVARD